PVRSVLVGDLHDEAKIGGDQFVAAAEISVLEAPRKPLLLLDGEQRVLVDFRQVGRQRARGSLRCLCGDLQQLTAPLSLTTSNREDTKGCLLTAKSRA